MAGGMISWAELFPRRGKLLTSAVMVLFLADSALSYPHYLAYFNSFLPAHRASGSLVDSNLDWGQELPGLKPRLDSLLQQRKETVYLNYFGTGKPSYYGIKAIELPPQFDASRPFEWKAGLYCVSATALQLGDEESLRWTENEERRYQLLRRVYRDRLVKGHSTHGKSSDGAGSDLLGLRSRIEYGEFLRMMAYLRHREPDELIGYSILIFKLTDDEVARALNGNPEGIIEQAD